MTVASLAPVFVGLQDPWMPRFVQRITGSTIGVVDLYGLEETMSYDSPIGCVEPHPDVINAARMECEVRNQTNDRIYRTPIDEILDESFSYLGDDILGIKAIVWQFTTPYNQYLVSDENGRPVANVPSAAALDMMEAYVLTRVTQRWTTLQMMYM